MEQIIEMHVARASDRFMGSVLVAREEEIVFARSYGSLNVSRTEPIGAETRFPIASVSKQFTAAAILLLAERGRLQLEDPVSRHLPNTPAAWRDITLYHLLTHTSGLPNTPAFRSFPLVFSPGTDFLYSNPGYVLLADVIQRASGQTFEDFLRGNLFQPLGMNDSGSVTSTALVPRGATGHFRQAGGWVVAAPFDLRIAWGAGSLYSTPEDLLRWSRGLFGGRVLSAGSLDRMVTPFFGDYALGVAARNWGGRRVITHDGTLDGYRSILACFPESGLTVVVLSNVHESGVEEIAQELAAVVFEAGPAVVVQPRDGVVATGREVSFAAAASGDANYQWQESRDGGRTWTNLSDGMGYGGTMTAVLTLSNVTPGMDGYRYRARMSASTGFSTSRMVTLTVTPTVFPGPSALALNPSGDLLVGDASNNTIHLVSSAGRAVLLAGTAGTQGAADGEGARASFRLPAGMATDAAGNVYVADTGNSVIRRITPTGVVTTLAGSADNQGHRDGAGGAAWFNAPAGIAVDGAGTIYVADTGNSVIRRITPEGNVTTIAGTPGRQGSSDGMALAAEFNQPAGIAVDSAGTIHVADTLNHTIRRITPAGIVETRAGLGGVVGATDGTGSEALFNRPMGLAVGEGGRLYVADSGNATIRVVSPQGEVTTLLGLAGVAGLKDGMRQEAWLNQPTAIALDRRGALYVTDRGNGAIRRMDGDGMLTTLAIVTIPISVVPPPAPPPPAFPVPGATSPSASSGGGGAVGVCFLGALVLLTLLRWGPSVSRPRNRAE